MNRNGEEEIYDKGAVLSDCGLYRYRLWRQWGSGGRTACFVMLNPSTADAQQDDPTIRRCIGFARTWGMDRLVVVNLFAYRATEPKNLINGLGTGIIGRDNDESIMYAANGAAVIVAAWGTSGTLYGRDKQVLKMLAGRVSALRLSKDGHPCHPLYLPANLKPINLPAKAEKGAGE